MSGVNKVILVGRLGKDPEVRNLENGAAVANFTLATSESYKDKTTGEKKEITEWHNVVLWRGLAEISRLAFAMGGRRETLSGLSGLGDLVLTCTGELSRNRKVGIELGRGRSLDEILSGMKMVAEGVRTTSVALKLAERHGIELPIAAQMQEVLEGRKKPREAAAELMGRPQRNER